MFNILHARADTLRPHKEPRIQIRMPSGPKRAPIDTRRAGGKSARHANRQRRRPAPSIPIADNLAGHAPPGQDAERKAIYRDLEALRAADFDIRQKRGKEWHLAQRPLEFEELTMLVDAVQSSPFLTDELTEHLIILPGGPRLPLVWHLCSRKIQHRART